ncbi:DNA polymerase-4/DNA polymerase V [Halolactibacillus halophilus]|uniref:DNA polymerase IV n=1 Tax=Halolactibacillus halophilus TaxID=306540 RepID=A0A1I5SZ48_9BACI|nr:DNA polymerase IV [Halolactibacillus halophilus]GEM02793.1 DNA polymerase IV 2 [Halolactibacillus halophilus]SFP75496.1 DNA polymerase-4/DNA polymerase V [Halolactibacillus halophilus]
MERIIFLVDMQSFYASIEKVTHPRFRHKPVVVAGDPNQRSGIILAACPLAKASGIKTAEPLWQARAKCPEVEVVKPHMALYIDVSMQITRVLEKYSDLVEVYSIDEQFVDVTHSVHLFKDRYRMAEAIHDEILDTIGIESRIGIGPTKVLAKMACDHFAKKHPTGMYELTKDRIQVELWPRPIGDLFGVGHRMEAHFKRMGLYTIGSLANHPLIWIKKRFGINGEVLYRFSHGIDPSPVTKHTHIKQKAIGHHMTLPRDYVKREDILVVLRELSEEVARRTRKQRYLGSGVSIYVRGHDFNRHDGFKCQVKLATPTAVSDDIYTAARQLFDQSWNAQPIRSVGVTLTHLEDKMTRQLSLFDDPIKKERLAEVMDQLKETFGADSVMRASSLTDAGQAKIRANKIGGHWK